MQVSNYNEPTEMFHVQQKRVIVQFPQGLVGKAVFSKESSHLEATFKTVGIQVPPGETENYKLTEGQRFIRLEDKGFGKAFYELHFQRHMDKEKFNWRPISN
ncbi:MAG: hypothetical protein K940chlam9_00821 [Chlamydiae bacterium]|nr:hypothetical protein [Chlamydiota bacterium]